MELKKRDGGKTLGIIGGMGPLATADLFNKIIMLTDAASDEEHIHIVIDNNPKIPDRTKAVLEGSDAPFPYILHSAQRLMNMGADILLLPCNTSHVFYPRLCEAIGVPVINMVEETAKQVSAMGFKKAGLLATSGTLYAGLYEKALDRHGIEAVLPSAGGQNEVMRIIYEGVKAGRDKFDTSVLREELSSMAGGGAQTLILGCTELPLAFEKYGIEFPSVDPGLILAKAAIIQAGYKVRQARG
jgi:aspartate racemase